MEPLITMLSEVIFKNPVYFSFKDFNANSSSLKCADSKSML